MTFARTALVFLISLLACCVSADAALTQRNHANELRGSMKRAVSNAADDDSAEDDDDDDDEDDDAAEEKDDKKENVEVTQVDSQETKEVNAIKLHLHDKHEKNDDKKADKNADKKAEKKEKVVVTKVDVQESKQMHALKHDLLENAEEQEEFNKKIEHLKHLTDESKSDQEIDASAALVGNETQSPAMANMLGKIWKETRMFGTPGYSEHVDEELQKLQMTQHKLEAKLADKEGHKTSAEMHKEASVKKKPEGAVENVNEGHGVHIEGEDGELEEEALAKFVVIPIGCAIITALCLGGLLEKYEISWLPESAITMVVGAGLGFFMQAAIGHTAFFSDEDVFNKTCSTLLMLFLLPILIFESGWSLRTKDFASQFEYIMLFAVVGSLISFMVVGALIFYTGESGLGFHSIGFARTAFAYASLIAATDPVATLATYSKLKVDPLLNILVFGDSTFNDAVAIVLFKVLNSDAIMGTVDSRPSHAELSYHIGTGIVSIFLGSVGVGLIIGALFLLIARFFDLRHAPRLEILALVVIGYICFAVGEVVGMSGIIATVFCSILLGIYARPHLSVHGSLLGSFFLQQLAHFMDTCVFLLTGFCLVHLGPRGVWFGGIVMLICLIGRACAIFPLGFLTNMMKRSFAAREGLREEDVHLLSTKAMFMMWHAGLRGGIALTLCMQLGPWVDILDGPETRHLLQTATYCMICVFLLVFGGSTEACLKKCGIAMGESSASDGLYKTEAPRSLQRLLASIDEKVCVPLFVGHARMAERIKEANTEELVVEDVLRSAMNSGSSRSQENSSGRVQ